MLYFFFSSRRRHTRYIGDWSSDVCSSDLGGFILVLRQGSHDLRRPAGPLCDATAVALLAALLGGAALGEAHLAPSRSEERRVGKECRCGWSPDHDEK